MNINLISPEENGHRYTVRFKEDVNIPPNSKIYLNHATLSRKGNFNLNNDCELMIVVPQNTATPTDLEQNIYPSRTEGDTSVFNKPLYDGTAVSRYGKATVPKGVYTYTEMVNAIQTAIDAILTNTNNGANMSLYRSIKISDLEDDYITPNEADVAFGIIQKGGEGGSSTDIVQKESFVLSTTNGRGIATINDTNGITAVAGTTLDDGGGRSVWNCYGVSDKKLNYYNNPDNRRVYDYKGIQCLSRQSPQELSANNGAICIGVFSQDYALGLYGTEGAPNALNRDDRDRTRLTAQINPDTDGNGGSFNPRQTHYQQRTNGAITTNANEKNLCMPCYVMLDGRGTGECRLKVVSARKGDSNRNLSNRALYYANQGDHQTGAITLFNKTCSSLGLSLADQVELFIFFTVGGYASNDATRINTRGGSISINVLNGKSMIIDKPLGDQPTESVLVSRRPIFNMNYILDARNDAVVVADGGRSRLDYTRVPCVNSQQPFKVFMSGLKDGEGWDDIQYDPIVGLGDNATKPISIIRRYGIVADDELANQINVEKKTDFERNLNKNFNYDIGTLSRLYYPNTRDTSSSNSKQIATTKMTLPWRRMGYSVKVNSLPLRSFKNTANALHGGFSKNILANIPAPFKDTDTDYNAQDTHILTSTYEPPFKVNNNLNNQAFTTNKFDVEIVNSKTDEPATEILNSVINFTIEPPNAVVNENSIQNIKNL